MDTQPAPNNGIPAATSTTQETIFSDVVDTTPYEKNLKTARIYLYILTALQIGVGIYQYTTTEDRELALIMGGIPAGIGILFLLFAIWSYTKPAIAFMTALVTFIVAHGITMFFDTSSIYKGIILKILVIVALIKGFNDARQVEKLRESVGRAD
jgi:hypothetical protein